MLAAWVAAVFDPGHTGHPKSRGTACRTDREAMRPPRGTVAGPMGADAGPVLNTSTTVQDASRG